MVLTKTPVIVHGSGRTDTGVHALGQVFHFVSATAIPQSRMVAALNSRLPEDIAAVGAEIAADGFHARYDVLEKTYRYRILNAPVRSPILSRYAWHVPEVLSMSRMEQAISQLLGTHDFASFEASGSPRSTTVRTMKAVRVEKCGDEIVMEFTADGFLYHMVRNLVGTLVEIGMGKRPADMKSLLAVQDRSLAGITAPPQGLYLLHVKY